MLIWAKVEDEVAATPDRLQDQKLQLQRFFNVPVVFIFHQLDSWQRKRLIERQVGFIQTDKQLYVPELFLQLNDIRSGYNFTGSRSEHLSFAAQVSVLYHLQRESLEVQSAQQIAIKLGYSAMTVSRIIRELQQFELITVEPGKERTITFKERGKALWQLVLPRLRSPVRQIWFSYGPFGSSNTLEAGETALSTYTLLAGPRVTYLAISKDQFRSLQTLQKLPELNIHQGNYCLQVWQYEPGILVEPGHFTVDKLSLYLTLMNEEDERIKAALQEMLKQILW